MSKYRSIKTVVDGITFDSKREAARYGELKAMVKKKAIKNLILQPKFEIKVNGLKICTYRGDFQYIDVTTGETITEDVKGILTPVYRLKKKLVKAVYGVEIKETK